MTNSSSSSNNTNGIDLPHVPGDLLAVLDARFPDKCPHISEPDRMIWFKAGQRSVIAILVDQVRRQKEADTLAEIFTHTKARH